MYPYYDQILFDLLIVVMYLLVDALVIYLYHLDLINLMLLLLHFLKIILFHFLEMFPMMKKKIVVVVVVVAVGEVLYDDFRRFQERQHRLNLNYQMFVLDHPLKKKKKK
jgi:hypothetical protein